MVIGSGPRVAVVEVEEVPGIAGESGLQSTQIAIPPAYATQQP